MAKLCITSCMRSSVSPGLPDFARLKARYFQLPHQLLVTGTIALVTFAGRADEAFLVLRLVHPSGRYWKPGFKTMTDPTGMSSLEKTPVVEAN